MTKYNYRNSKSYKLVIFILIFVNFFVFIHWFIGRNTIQNYFKYKQELKKRHIVLSDKINERINIEETMEKLKSDNTDNAMLEEILRKNLYLSLPDEKIIME